MYFEHNISHEFTFDSKFMKVQGAHIHYVDVGEGDPIVFVHGVPTSSYLWRNIIPTLQSKARCIALDLIGFGQSDKPEIDYTIKEHIQFFNSFIDALNLKNITLVLHGWGSVIGSHYIAQHLNNIKAVVFYEAHIHPETDWNLLSLPVQQLAGLIKSPKQVEKAILYDNYFLKKIFPMSMLHLPHIKIMEQYLAPFELPESRRPLLQYIYELPIGENHSESKSLISQYSSVIQKTSFPKLLLYSVPGFLAPIETIKWCKDNFTNLELVDLGEELHFAQETMPGRFAQILDRWYSELN